MSTYETLELKDERYMGDGAYIYVYFNNETFEYDVYETPMYGGKDQFLESFDTFVQAKEYADKLC